MLKNTCFLGEFWYKINNEIRSRGDIQMLEITSVELKKIDKEGSRHKATASVVLNNCFVIETIRVIQLDDKLILAMPYRETPKGKRDVAHPITQECRKMFEDAIFAEYNK